MAKNLPVYKQMADAEIETQTRLMPGRFFLLKSDGLTVCLIVLKNKPIFEGNNLVMNKPEERNIRINKVLRELNISLEKAINYFRENGIIIEASPNSKITQSEYEVLLFQFSSKPKQILELENFYNITLKLVPKIENIYSFDKRNTCCLNEKKEIVGLSLHDNLIIDIKPLQGLTALTALNLSDNQITDIKPLEGLTALTTLYILNNKITDIKPLEGLTALTFLYLSYNKITDIKPLEGLTALTTLYLTDNQISHIKPLEGLTALTKLYLDYNQITSIKPLEGLKALKLLDLFVNQITDIKPLEGLTALTSLVLTGNQITDIKPLEGLTALTELNLYNNQITDIKPLEGLTALTELRLSDNKITNIKPLEGLTALTLLDLSRNQITDIKPLEGLTALTSLVLTGNQITDIKPLEGLMALTEINLSDNQITVIKPLHGLTALTGLGIDKNPFLDTIELKLEPNQNHLDDIVNALKKIDDEQIKATLPEKIILLGNHASGKSSLLHYLQNKNLNYPLDDSTHILRIEKYPAKFDKLPKAIVYDFGGQDFYHGIYQAFITNSATTLFLWDETTNKNEIKPDSTGRINRNFNVDYWLGERKHKDYKGAIVLIQSHSDIENTKRSSYLNINKDIVDEFFISLKRGNVDKSNLNKLNYLKTTIDDLIETKQIETNEKGTISKPYYNFLKFILNADATHETIAKEILRKQYIVKEDSRFEYDIEQLHKQGILLVHNENIWMNPEELVKHIHQTILTKEIVGNGVIEKQDFDKKGFDKNIIEMLLANKIIFLHKNGLSKENNHQEEYIIPNFLPLISEAKIDYDLMTFGMDNPLFSLKFKDYLPFGLINEMICYFGVLPDNKKFWRDQLVFTISEKNEKDNKSLNKKVQILIQLDFENLEIKVFAVFNNGTSKTFNDNVERYLFFSIMAMYMKYPIIPEGFDDYVLMFNKFNVNLNKGAEFLHYNEEENDGVNYSKQALFQEFYYSNKMNMYHFENFDLLISKNNKHFIDYKKLKKTDKNESKIETFIFNNGIKEHYKAMPVAVYQNFVHKVLKVMKKIFISYSKSDLTLVNEFQDHLTSLKLDNVISSWYCTELIAGGEWDQEIQQKFDEADIVCFMISSNLMRTDYIHKYEIAKAFERKEKDSKFRIVPIILDFCSWRTQKNNLGDFTALPYTAKPVCDFKNKNMAWFIIVECIRFMIDSDSQPVGDDWFNKPTLPVNIRKLYERIVEGKVDDNSN